MKLMRKSQQEGVTILEVMLVIVIGASLLLLSLNQYQTFTFDNNVRKVQQNVNLIFLAASNYYRKECYGTSKPGAPDMMQMVPGTLNPKHDPAPSNPFPISLKSDLFDTGMLQPLAINPIVDDDDGNGYIVQFNQYQAPREVCLRAQDTSKPATIDDNCAEKVSVGTIIGWRIQVAVKLRKTEIAEQLKSYLSADCLSTFNGTTVIACESAADFAAACQSYRAQAESDPKLGYLSKVADDMGCPPLGETANYGNYAVWERAPATPSTSFGTSSPLYMSAPNRSQFTHMYNTDPILNLTNGMTTSDQYYLCGS